jgi:hypothetical protein
MDKNEAKRRWNADNPEKVKASRERYNEKRRQKRADQEYRAAENARHYELRKDVSPERKAEIQKRDREYHRQWRQANAKERYAKMKERMAADPEYAAHVKANWARSYAKQPKAGNETPEQREKRLQRKREYRAKKAREEKMKDALVPARTRDAATAAPVKKPPVYHKPRMGRMQALSKWYGY